MIRAMVRLFLPEEDNSPPGRAAQTKPPDPRFTDQTALADIQMRPGRITPQAIFVPDMPEG